LLWAHQLVTFQEALRFGLAVPPAAAVAASGVILVAALAAPVSQATLGYPSGEFFYESLFPICHQYPTRSLWILGQPCGLCARCLGGYGGLVLLPVLYVAGALRRVDAAFFLLLGMSLFALGVGDAVVKFAIGIDGSNSWRFGTGLLGGLGFAMMLAWPWKKVSQKEGID
jgi:uncharacterized membrane protein